MPRPMFLGDGRGGLCEGEGLSEMRDLCERGCDLGVCDQGVGGVTSWGCGVRHPPPPPPPRYRQHGQ